MKRVEAEVGLRPGLNCQPFEDAIRTTLAQYTLALKQLAGATRSEDESDTENPSSDVKAVAPNPRTDARAS